MLQNFIWVHACIQPTLFFLLVIWLNTRILVLLTFEYGSPWSSVVFCLKSNGMFSLSFAWFNHVLIVFKEKLNMNDFVTYSARKFQTSRVSKLKTNVGCKWEFRKKTTLFSWKPRWRYSIPIYMYISSGEHFNRTSHWLKQCLGSDDLCPYRLLHF